MHDLKLEQACSCCVACGSTDKSVRRTTASGAACGEGERPSVMHNLSVEPTLLPGVLAGAAVEAGAGLAAGLHSVITSACRMGVTQV
jgi:hypothetical protein